MKLILFSHNLKQNTTTPYQKNKLPTMNKSYLSSIKNTVLLSKPSTAIRLLLMVLFVSLFVNVASAATYYSRVSGNFATLGTWSTSSTGTPTNTTALSATDNFIIQSGNTVTIAANTVCNNLTIDSGGILRFTGNRSLTVSAATNVSGTFTLSGTRTKTFTGNVTINSSGIWSETTAAPAPISYGGNLQNDGTYTVNTGTHTFSGSGMTISGTSPISIPDVNFIGSYTNNGTLTATNVLSGTGGLTQGSSGILNIGGASGITTLTATAVGNTINYTGAAAQTVKAITYYNLGFSGAGIKTAVGNITANNDFTLTTGTFVLNNGTSYTLTIGGDYLQTRGIFDFNFGTSGTSTMNLAGNLINTNTVLGSLTTFGAGAPNGNIVFNGTGLQVLNIPTAAAADWVNYKINTGSNVALSSNLLLTGENTTNGKSQVIISGTLDIGTNTVTAASTYSNGAAFTLNSGATLITANTLGINGSVSSTNTTRVFNTGASYVFNGTLAQVTSIGMPATVSNLTINNTAGVTLVQATTITNNFSIVTGFANLGTFTHTAGTLTIGDEGAVAGSWGSTSSPATNTSNTFFAATTGIVNVSTSSCTTTTWNGISWSKGTPSIGKNIIFNSGYTATGSISGCSCTVNSGNVTIPTGNNLILGGKLTVNAPATLTFEDTSSLVQTTLFTGANSGNITYKRITAPIRQMDYTYWSSPVKPMAGGGYLLGSIATSQNYLSYDSSVTNDWKYENASKEMTNGVGYAIQGPSTMAGSPYSASFVGVPNNGNVTVPVIFTNPLNLLQTDPNYGVSYLLGNPYPSAINADTFLSTNSSVLDGTLYFWTHYTEIGLGTSNLGSGALAFTSDDYASYNYTGGVSGIGYAAPTIGLSAIAKDIPTGKIAAGQGFFATSIANGNVVFNNGMRLAGTTLANKTGTNQQFFKTKNPDTKTASIIEKNRIWLDLSNNQGAFKQTLIGYVTDATNDYDSRFDGESFDGNEFVDFYSINQDKNLVIQGRALPFDENDEVPLGYRTTINGEFTINIDQVDGSLTNQPVFIEDKLTNTVFDLKSGNYTFDTLAGTFDDRFVLRYTNKTLSVDETDKEDGILVLYSNNYKTLIIHNNNMDTTVNSVTLFNITGQNIANWEVNDFEQTNIQFPIKNISSGIYIVKVKTTKGVSSKKIIIR